MSKEAMKLALGKIKSARDCHFAAIDTLLFEAEEILEEALAEQPAQQALDKMAENARDLGLDYEHPTQYWRAHASDYERGVIDGMQKQMQSSVDRAVNAMAEQPAQQEVDWEKLYRLEVKKKDALAAKYERDTGKKLTRIIPMAEQPAQQQEPVAWRVKWPAIGGGYKWLMVDRPLMEKEGFENEALYTSPPAHRTWVGLTDEEKSDIWCVVTNRDFVTEDTHVYADAIEAKLKEKNNG